VLLFQKALPEWFIKLFTKEFDWVLDPFVGCGTTIEAANGLRRNCLGIDIIPEYIAIAKSKVKEKKYYLFETGIEHGPGN